MMQFKNMLNSSLSELFRRLKEKIQNGLNGGSYEEQLLRKRGQLVPVPVKNRREPSN
jgi:hypothetical protein